MSENVPAGASPSSVQIDLRSARAYEARMVEGSRSAPGEEATSLPAGASLLEKLCVYFDAFPEKICDFLPETFAGPLPQARIALLSGSQTERRHYVDGTYCEEVPFEVRLRIGGQSMREKLDAVRFFEDLVRYTKDFPLTGEVDGVRFWGVRPLSGVEKSAILATGAEEYRMSFCVSRFVV